MIEKQNASSLQRVLKICCLKGHTTYVIGAVDGNHLFIIAPNLDPVSYYYYHFRKQFVSLLLEALLTSFEGE